jgi:hypothetical protein
VFISLLRQALAALCVLAVLGSAAAAEARLPQDPPQEFSRLKRRAESLIRPLERDPAYVRRRAQCMAEKGARASTAAASAECTRILSCEQALHAGDCLDYAECYLHELRYAGVVAWDVFVLIPAGGGRRPKGHHVVIAVDPRDRSLWVFDNRQPWPVRPSALRRQGYVVAARYTDTGAG